MRDSCGLCVGLYTGEEEVEMDRLVLKNPHSPTGSLGKSGKSSTKKNNANTPTSTISTPPTSPKSAKNKLPSIVETVDEAVRVGTVDEEEEPAQIEEKKDDDDEGAMVAASTVCVLTIPEEIRTPLSSDFTAVPAAGEEDEVDADEDGLTSRPQRNFDQNPTQLYLTLMRKDWDGTILRSGQAPEEVGTWIYRKENDGSNKLRWRLLPIHAAIIFGAPVSVLKAFLTVDAKAALAADDQGMVPLHLAVRMGCPAPIIRALVHAAPKSKQSHDRKGRTPRDLALRQTGTVRELLLAALDETDTIQPRAVVVVPQPSPIVEVEVPPPAASPKEEAEEVAAAPAVTPVVVQERSFLSTVFTPSPTVQYKPDPALAARVHLLELQLDRSETGRKELQDRVEKMIATEQRLRADHVALQESAATATTTYVEAETANKAVITNLVNQVGDLQGKITGLTCEKAEVEASLAHLHEQMDEERGEHKLLVLQFERDLSTTTTLQNEAEARVAQLSADNERMQRTLEQNAADMLALRETIASHEMKIEEVTLSEQELAWKVNTLQETIKNLPDPVAHEREIACLESDKKELKSTVHKLSIKLYKVVGFLDEMVQEQDAIIAESLTNATGATPTDGSDSAAADGSSSSSAVTDTDRQKMLTNVTGMKVQIGAIIESVLGSMPDYRVTDEEDDEEDDEPETEA